MLKKSSFQAKGAVLCYVKHTGPSSILNFFRAFPTSFTATSTMGNLKTNTVVTICGGLGRNLNSVVPKIFAGHEFVRIGQRTNGFLKL